MSTKRVILANDSRLLREALQRVIDKTDQLEALQELPDPQELPSTIKRFDPDWVIVSPQAEKKGYGWIDSYPEDFPTVRFIFLSPESHTIKLKWQTAYEEDLAELSVNDFILLLEEDGLQT